MLLFKSDVLSVRPQYERGMFWDRAEYNQGVRHKRNAVSTGYCRLNLRSRLPLMVISRRCGGAPLSVVHVLKSRLFDRHRDNCSSKIGRPHICASCPLVLLLYFFLPWILPASLRSWFVPFNSWYLAPELPVRDVLRGCFQIASFFRHLRAPWSKAGLPTC